jgi:hypothetical protein
MVPQWSEGTFAERSKRYRRLKRKYASYKKPALRDEASKFHLTPAKSNNDTVQRIIKHRLDNNIPPTPPTVTESVAPPSSTTAENIFSISAQSQISNSSSSSPSTAVPQAPTLPANTYTSEQLNKLTIADLKPILEKLGQPKTGNKADLISRILEVQ